MGGSNVGSNPHALKWAGVIASGTAGIIPRLNGAFHPLDKWERVNCASTVERVPRSIPDISAGYIWLRFCPMGK